MRKVIRKRIRHEEGGVNLVADINVVIATGDRGSTHTSVSSVQRAEQRSERTTPPAHHPDDAPEKEK